MPVKRADGEGTLRRLPNGSWEGRISAGTDALTGRRVRIKRTADTKAAVLAKLEEARKAARTSGTSGSVAAPIGRNPTVAQWFTHFQALQSAKPAISPRTLGGYATDRQHILPALGRTKIQRLTRAQIEALYASLHERGLSNSTVSHVHRTLRAVLNRAADCGLISANPAVGISVAEIGRAAGEITPLSSEETAAVLTAAYGRRNSARWMAAVVLGLRQGEALGLLEADYSRDDATLTVSKQLQRLPYKHGCSDPTRCLHAKTGKRARAVDCPVRRPGGGLQTRLTKTRQQRTYALSGVMCELLDRQIAANEHARRNVTGWQDDGYLFPAPAGGPVDPRADSDEWHALLRAAGVRPVTLHTARHTAASALLVRDGLSETALMQVMGWSPGSRHMLSRYGHLMDEGRRRIAELQDASLPPLPPRKPGNKP
jgi:integrase